MHSCSPARLSFSLCLLATLLAASGCGESRVGGPKAAAVADAVTVFDPEQTCVSTDAHARHQAMGISCVTCHPCGGAMGFTSVLTYTSGTTTAGGVVTRGDATTPTTCSVGCHSPMGSPAHTVAWNEPGPLACTTCHDVATLLTRIPLHPAVSADMTRADCQQCHDTSSHTQGDVVLVGHVAGWMDPASATFHPFSANQGLASCRACHGADLGGGAANVACATCHDQDLPPGVASWRQNCVMCHGGTDNPTGAPPKATWGNAGDAVRIGAHSTHVAASAISPGFGCEVCHVKPADALAAGHVDPSTAEVIFAGLAVNGVVPPPAWERTAATCSNTYCHGATMGGSTPVWTRVGQGEAACGTCHGVPPPPPHPAVDTTDGLVRCSVCHALTINPIGQLIPPSEGGAHLNGMLEASGHDAQWMDTTSPTFHAFSADRGIQSCTGCHGAALEGGAVGVACAQCHDQDLPPGVTSWLENCVMCHGGTDNETGAPPKATWGNAGDPARGGGIADPLRVGAHTKHLTTALTTSVGCGSCHVVPTQALSPNHANNGDSMATLTWSGVVLTGGAQPQWDRTAGTCASTYCHGNYSGVYAYSVWDWGSDQAVTVTVNYAGGRATPGWTDAPVTCGSCHGSPPAATGYWHSPNHGNFPRHRECQLCHADAASVNGVPTGITNPALHVNGAIDVAPRWSNECFGCH